MVTRGWADSEEIRRVEPEGKGGADFYANICETLCHGEATHTRGMSTPPRRRRRRKRRRSLVLGGTSFAEFRHRCDSRILRRRRIEFVCSNLHLNRIDARAHTIRSIDCDRSVRICSFGAKRRWGRKDCAKVLKYLKSQSFKRMLYISSNF